MGLSPQDIATIVSALQESDWDEAVVVVEDARIAVARNGARLSGANRFDASAPDQRPVTPPTAPPSAPLPTAAATPPAQESAPAIPVPTTPAAQAPTGIVIPAPTVGVFWSSPEPGSAPFVRIGDHVEAGDILCIVEVMKLMTNVATTVAGTVSAVLVGNGDDVEFGTPLFSIDED